MAQGVCGWLATVLGAVGSAGSRRRWGLRSVAGYLGLTLVFCVGGASRGDLIAIFWGAFASASGVFILVGEGGGWALGYHSVGFRHFLMFPNFLRS